MIGDAGLPDDLPGASAGKGETLVSAWPDWLLNGEKRPSGRVAFCTRKNVYKKNEPLLPSGLIGPVRLVPAVVEPLGGSP